MSDKKRAGGTVPREEYRAACIEVIRLAGCAVNGRSPSPGYAGRIKEILDSGLLFNAAKRHMLTSAVATALESAGIYDRAFEEEKAKALRKSVLLEHDREEITAEFEKQGIRHTPLKGTVLQYDYPSFGMRQMSDVDILIDPDRAADARKIMESLGFTTDLYGVSEQDVYQKPPVSNFELHRELFGDREERPVREYYADAARLLIPVEGKSCEYRFSDRDFYVYITAHACKHFSNAGTGLRSLLDVYVFLRGHRDTVDLQNAESELDLLGIGDFAGTFRTLAFRLFEEPVEDDAFPENLSAE
ncbi:MAG: nucleotidyltransferase family protein, partial [Clostridia bacterium]|nr:nucleotidyltransferase family protein [Clostridia bacterium]